MASEGLQVKNDDAGDNATAFLVDLVSNRKIPITSPRCKVGRDDLNDIVISGDQSISRFHFVITKENGQYMVQDGKSRHGTFLNGNQIISPEPIHDGDVLKVGVSLFWFVIEASVIGAGNDKFAPVDVELIDQQELEFMNLDGDPDTDAPAAATSGPQPVSAADPAPKSNTATQEVPTLSEAAIMQAAAAIAEKKRYSGPGETTAAIPSLSDDLMPGESLTRDNEASSLSAESQSTESAPQTSESTPPSADTTPEPVEDDSEITVAMLLDPLHKETAAKNKAKDHKSKDPNDPMNTLVNIDAMKPSASEAPPPKLEATRGDLEAAEAQKQSDEHKQEAPTEPALSNFTDFNSSTSQFSDYQYSSNNDALTKEPALSESSGLPELVVQPEPITDSMAKPGESTASPAAEDSKAAAGMDNLFGFDGTDDLPEEHDADAAVTGTEQTHGEAPSTLGKFAEIIGEASSPTEKKTEDSTSLKSVLNFQSADKAENEPSRELDTVDSAKGQAEPQTTNGAKGMSIVKEGASTVPDWCKRYFGTELNQLGKELGELNEQVRLAQQKIKDVEGRVALTKGLRNTLLTAQGEELVEACGKVLTMLGWKVKVSDEDKHELRLETNDDKGISIARIVWTETQADRTHLGQLSISQTRFWCEQGVEPKGILIVSKGGESAPTLSQSDRDSELAEYASKKNVCLMTTLQLLSVYKDIALGEGTADKVRAVILDSSGWLSGYNLEPGSEPMEKEEGASGTNKLSSLLSA